MFWAHREDTVGLFDPDPDGAQNPGAGGGALPRRDPAGAAKRTANLFGGNRSGDRTAFFGGDPPDDRTEALPVARAGGPGDGAEASATEILDVDLVARAKRRMDFLGRNPASESTQDFPAPAFTDETPIVDRDREPAWPRAIEMPDSGTTADPGTPDKQPGTALALRDPGAPATATPSVAASLAAAGRAAKAHRTRKRRRTLAITVLTMVTVLGGAATGYFIVDALRGTDTGNPSQVRPEPDDGPADGGEPAGQSPGPEATSPGGAGATGATGAPVPGSSSASRPPDKPSSAPTSRRPSSRPSKPPQPSPSKPPPSPTPSATPTDPPA